MLELSFSSCDRFLAAVNRYAFRPLVIHLKFMPKLFITPYGFYDCLELLALTIEKIYLCIGRLNIPRINVTLFKVLEVVINFWG